MPKTELKLENATGYEDLQERLEFFVSEMRTDAVKADDGNKAAGVRFRNGLNQIKKAMTPAKKMTMEW